MSYPPPEEPVVVDPEGPPLESFVPRRTVESNPLARLDDRIRRLESQISAMQKANTLRSASLSDDAVLTVLDATDTAVARLGLLSDGTHGIEVFSGGVWKKVT